MKHIVILSILILSSTLVLCERHRNQVKAQNSTDNATSLVGLSYEFQGRDWPGLCSSGQQQSPINIVDKINTELDLFSQLTFNYKLNPSSTTQSKFFYDGIGLTLDANIGEMTFTHEDLTVETYKAEKIYIRYPSEHLITMDSMTPRYPLEIQIVHTLSKSTNSETTNKKLKVQNAIVSILFRDGSPVGDRFLQRLGIGDDAPMVTPQKNSYIQNTQVRYNDGFYLDNDALNSLKNIINYNHHVYRYYGSQTIPPCAEKVAWFVFAKPRSVSNKQIEFIQNLVIRERQKFTGKENISGYLSKYFGNNRGVQIFDDEKRGRIFSMVKGIKMINGLPQSKN